MTSSIRSAAIRGGSIAVLAAMLSAPALADDADSSGGEIVVTATKRSANLQDVPLSITAIGGADIADKQIRDGIGLARQTPNLAAESAMGAAMPRYRLRGIGTNDFTPTATSAVGIYEDEVFISAGSAQSEPLYDLDRVEVLRGPQGSLWGKNTTAGAIHYVTTKPSDTLTGQGRAVYGGDNTVELEAGLGGPLADKLNFRVAGVYKSRDGQYHNDFTDAKAGGYDIWDLRGQLGYEFTPDATLLVKVHGGVSKQHQPLQHVGLLPGGADSDGYVERDSETALSNNGSDFTRARRFGTDARLDVNLGGARLIDIAAYEKSSSLIYSDDDANPVSEYHERYGGASETFTNELRLESPDGNRFGWIVGTYYLHDKTNSFGQLGLYSPINFGVDGAAYDFDTRTDNFAGFASISFEVTPRFKLTAGGRYTWEKKSIAGIAYDYETQGRNVFDASVVKNVYIDTANGIYRTGGVGSDALTPTPGSRSWKKFTWDASADYKATDDILLFARVARGFRSGAYNTYIASPGDLSVYNPETLTSYEAGIKTSWLDRKVTFNATAFHYDIDDMQVTVLQTVGAQTQNAATARVNGFEIEAAARPFAGLSLNAGYGFQDSKYTDFANASVPTPINQGNPLDLTGQSLERAPRHTLNLSGSYEIALGSGTLTFSTDWRYTSRYRFHTWSDATNNTPAAFLANAATRQLVRDTFSQKELWLGDARLAYRTEGGIEVAAWVKNLTNEYYRTNTFGMFFNRSMSTYPGERRTYGLSAAYRF
ncbi:TonB-dependent receptor [Novosphingobium sp. fls2-241-R2A-195]|jgi:iron complex outermembrane receptor protein|uniref:TonB-dependent receptor n=1 Tax=Novosphingobium sp. fls2-241-R2A-195 TaxID=3040296 RepID=UPI00254ABF89|nr:TonB-dependent receptor [Novosphingobium sp. fls2-241-R2A-195]